jgi:hypothetical protein
MTSLEKFDNFLKRVDLQRYRALYRPIKLVEMDLPKNIQAIKLLYIVYWDEKNFVDYEHFYGRYLSEYERDIESFREKIGMCEDCFYKGLPARIYRTWASLITQIHAGYVAESVFGLETVSMSEELDHSGADFQVVYKDVVLNYQVKKKSFSREVRKEKEVKESIYGEFIDIKYEVPSDDIFKDPKTKKGEIRIPYKRFIENKELKRFDNGFVVFTSDTFLPKKEEIDKIK